MLSGRPMHGIRSGTASWPHTKRRLRGTSRVVNRRVRTLCAGEGNLETMTSLTRIQMISNLRRLNGVKTEQYEANSQYAGEKETFWDGMCLFFRAHGKDVSRVDRRNMESRWVLFDEILWPFSPCKLVAVDFILSRPQGWRQSIIAWFKGLLLRKVDRFILHFKDTSEYETDLWYPSIQVRVCPLQSELLGKTLTGRSIL
jgi:hypothetical protein